MWQLCRTVPGTLLQTLAFWYGHDRHESQHSNIWFLVFSSSWILDIMETFFRAPHWNLSISSSGSLLLVVWPFKVTRIGRRRSLVWIMPHMWIVSKYGEIGATTKHFEVVTVQPCQLWPSFLSIFSADDKEDDRHGYDNSVLIAWALREIHLILVYLICWPRIHSYNCVNNLHDSENLFLLKTTYLMSGNLMAWYVAIHSSCYNKKSFLL